MKLEKVIRYQKGRAPGNDLISDKQILYLTPEYLRNKSAPNFISDFPSKVEVADGDLLLLWDGSNAGEFFVGKKGVLSSTMVKFNFNEVENNREFLFYQLKSFEGYLKSQTNGSGIPHVDRELLLGLEIEHFEKNEQTKIAAILRTTDEAILQTEKLIAKYQRVKTGLMQDLLTKGIDEQGNVRNENTHKFKNSQIGKIPIEWDVCQLSEVNNYITSGSRNWSIFYSLEGALFVRITNLTREHINFRFDDLQRVNLQGSDEGTRTRLHEGDLLISITADLGIIGVVPSNLEKAYINQHIALFRIFDRAENNPRFLGHYLASIFGRAQFARLNDGGAKAGLNLSTILKIKFPKMNITEQDNISLILDKSDQIIMEHKIQLCKLQSVKIGLIQDLLSGRVRVK